MDKDSIEKEERKAFYKPNDDDYLIYTCWSCPWEGEGMFLTDAGECPECYVILKED